MKRPVKRAAGIKTSEAKIRKGMRAVALKNCRKTGWVQTQTLTNNNTNTNTNTNSSEVGNQPKLPVKRKPISAKVRHQVHLRDGGRCTHRDPQGQRCSSRRYLEIHHKTEVAMGGVPIH